MLKFTVRFYVVFSLFIMGCQSEEYNIFLEGCYLNKYRRNSITYEDVNIIQEASNFESFLISYGKLNDISKNNYISFLSSLNDLDQDFLLKFKDFDMKMSSKAELISPVALSIPHGCFFDLVEFNQKREVKDSTIDKIYNSLDEIIESGYLNDTSLNNTLINAIPDNDFQKISYRIPVIIICYQSVYQLSQ